MKSRKKIGKSMQKVYKSMKKNANECKSIQKYKERTSKVQGKYLGITRRLTENC